ncbi:MAG: hypothetical protein Q9201_000666 [Fulgogasparrea decipioides]
MTSSTPSFLSFLFLQYPLFLPAALVIYLTLVYTLRYRRSHYLTAQHSHHIHHMTVPLAHSIHNTLITLEFPSTFSLATTFALFKAYGIPSISSLLVHTNQLAGPPLASSKRYADTGALLLEAVLNEPGSKRSAEALGRINWLHDRFRYRGEGKGGIRDEDMLYTLSLFALEPMRWVKRYEWRELSQVEVCAVGTLWKYYGDALKVPFQLLPGFEKGWKDGGEWIRNLEEWSKEYEEKHMVPAESNHKLAEATLRIILCKMPKSLYGFGAKVFASIMEDKLRWAMLYVYLIYLFFIQQSRAGTNPNRIETPPPTYTKTLSLLVALRKFYLRHLSLPRYRPVTRMPTPSPTNDGRINLPRVRMHPWYIRPTFKKRWGLSALLTRLRGGVLPGDDPKFMPEGFLTRDLGPMGLVGKGHNEVDGEVQRLQEDGGRGCPFMAL